jgi:hypothetical protein
MAWFSVKKAAERTALRTYLFLTKINVEVKGKFVPVLNQAPHHKGVLGSGGIAAPIL